MENGNMEPRDYKTYVSLFQNMSKFMKHNTMIIHLNVSPEESLKRIKLRSRDCESSISLEYLKKLYKGYEEWLQQISKIIPVIKVDWSEYKTMDEVLDKVMDAYNKIHNIQYVSFNNSETNTNKSSKNINNCDNCDNDDTNNNCKNDNGNINNTTNNKN
jgi:deoxyadenosine kinase